MEKINQKEKERVEQSIREAVAWTVSSHGGNINLQQGRFITQEDLERVRRENLAHDFTKSK